MAHKNDYSCIVFYNGQKPKKWSFVHGLSKFAAFLNEKHNGWEYMNVYERRTNKFLKRFYPNSSIPYFLSIASLLMVSFFLTFSNSPSMTFINGFNNTATISTPKKQGGEACI